MENSTDYHSFKDLLQALEGSTVRVRTRASGEPWGRFAILILLSDNAMILQDGEDRTIINLHNIIEFELDTPVNNFIEKTTYTVSRQ